MNNDLPADPTALLARMVSIESVNEQICGRPAPETPLATELERIAAAWGLATRRLPVAPGQFNLLVGSPGAIEDDRPWLLLESHLDTVTIEGMTIAPTTPKIADGKMWGRGACDTKASGAAMLWALKQAVAAQQVANPTSIAFTVGEECRKEGIRALTGHHFSSLGRRPALAVVGEPTLLAPVIAHNGALRWKIATTGIPAHSSNPANGRSAISDMLRIVHDLEQNYIPSLAQSHSLTGKAQCSINQIHGGRQANMIPDRCEIVIDRRLIPGETSNDVLSAIASRIEELVRQSPGLRWSQEDVFDDAPMTPLCEDAILEFLRPVLAAMGLPCKAAGMPYGTDASNLTSSGIPAVVIGPGDIRQAHTVDEWIELSQLEAAVEFYAKLLRAPLPPSLA